jgi:hypothetical protein
MLSTAAGLLVSLPAKELAGFSPSGSLFEDAELRDVSVSDELRSALDVARQFCSTRKMPMLFVARPEIFTHGDTLQWLKSRLGRIKDHLCISDGSAVRPIPQLRNHLFLYRLGISDNAAAFHRLAHCAPELLGSMHSQVNTCMSCGRARKAICPPSVLLQIARPKAKSASSEFYRYRHHATLKVGIERTLKSRLPQALKSPGFHQITYVPMTETACKDRAFGKVLAGAISNSYADSKYGSIVRVPKLASTLARLEDRLEAVLQAVHPHICKLPSLSSPGVIFTTEDLNPAGLRAAGCSVDLVMHSSYEFWSHPKQYYDGFRSLDVYASRASDQDQVAFHKLLIPAFKRRPQLHRLRPDRGSSRSAKIETAGPKAR